MHIGALVHMYPPMHNAGAEHMLHAILSECVRRGHRASVAVSGPRADFEPFVLDGVRVGGVGLLDTSDVVLTHLDRTTDAEEYCLSTGKPCVQLFHNHARPQTARVCDLAVYNSQWMARDFPVDAPSIIVPPPIWPERYRVTPGDCITLINLTAAKGARLFYALAKARPDLQFLGVRGAYGAQIDPPDLPNLTVIDNCADVRDVYSRTRVLLVPSSYESYGRVAVEASVSGIPVIATGTPGLREALGDAGTFPHDPPALALGGEPPVSALPAWLEALDKVLGDWEAHSKSASWRIVDLDPHEDIDNFLDALETLRRPDAVYVCRSGEKNEELRYSLRSLTNIPHGHVYIAGGTPPSWVAGVARIPVAQTPHPYLNTTAAVRAACLDPRVSDPFILMNDDFFITEPLDALPTLNRGPIPNIVAETTERHGRRSDYAVGMETVADTSERLGHPKPLSFELHVPMLIDKATMLEAIALCPDDGMHKRTLYAALAGLKGETVSDCKLYSCDDPLPEGPFLSTCKATFPTALPALDRLFPDRCRYEAGEPTLPQPALDYPVKLGKDIPWFQGKPWVRGQMIDETTAIAMKQAGHLTDPRIPVGCLSTEQTAEAVRQ